jgi:hypothetical protein
MRKSVACSVLGVSLIRRILAFQVDLVSGDKPTSVVRVA